LRLFLISFFLIYGLMHLYALLKARAAFSLTYRSIIPLIFFMGVMIFAPIIVRYAENMEFEFLAIVMSHTGYIWMGLLFLFISLSILIDILKLTIYLTGFIFHAKLSAIIITSKVSFYMPLLFSILAAVYGNIEANNIRTEHVTIKTSKIPKALNGFRIVQISDVHLGLIVREKRLKIILDEVKKAKPDILVSTGDLVDGQINKLKGLAELLRDINPQYGKFAISGNHEFYAGFKQAMDFTKRAGFSLLRGKSVVIADAINLSGIDDGSGKNHPMFNSISEKKLLSGLDRKKFTVLLKHRPLLSNNVPGLFDLQLSGHTHKGQIFPFSLITRLYYPNDSGFMELSNNSKLYVSRGTGTWGPPIRFLSPPEVTIIELVREQ